MKIKFTVVALGLFFTLAVEAQLNVQIKAGDRQVCFKEILSFQDSVVTSTPTSFEWISSVATFSSPKTRNTTAIFSGSGDVILKTTNNVGDIFFDTVYVKENNLPLIQLANDVNVCCNYDQITLELLIEIPTESSASGSWSTSRNPNLITDGIFNTADACNQMSPFAKSLSSSLVYTYQDPTTLCINSDSMMITVIKLPKTQLQEMRYSQNTRSISLDDEIVHTPANTSTGFSSWRCLDSNAVINNFTLNMLENRGLDFAPEWWLNIDEANYTVQNDIEDIITLEFLFIEAGGCRARDTVDIKISKYGLGLDDFASFSPKLYPNPSNGTFYIENANLYEIDVFNLLGDKMMSEVSLDGSFRINSQGVYMIRLKDSSSEALYFKKVVVE
jgi:hypothetical protein